MLVVVLAHGRTDAFARGASSEQTLPRRAIRTLATATTAGSSASASADAVQMSAMHADECILVDDADRVIGHASKLECHLMANGPPLHRAFSVFIFNAKNELLLQQRSATKVTASH